MSGWPLALAGLLLAASAPPAAAQLDLGGGDDFGYGEAQPAAPRPSVGPYARAIELAFSTATWTEVRLATAPVEALSGLLERGYYHLEVVELLLLARDTGTPFADLVKERDAGKTFRKLAEERRQDPVALYEKSLALRRRVDAIFTGLSLATVAVSTPVAGEADQR